MGTIWAQETKRTERLSPAPYFRLTEKPYFFTFFFAFFLGLLLHPQVEHISTTSSIYIILLEF